MKLKVMDTFSVVSMPTTTIDHGFLSICSGDSPKDTTIMLCNGRLQRFKGVCLGSCLATKVFIGSLLARGRGWV